MRAHTTEMADVEERTGHEIGGDESGRCETGGHVGGGER